MEPERPFFARSRSGPNLAGVSSGNSDFRSRLLNTEFYSYKIYGYRYQQYVLARHTTFVSHASFCMLETGNLQCLFKKRELKEKCIRVEWYQQILSNLIFISCFIYFYNFSLLFVVS